MLIVLAFVLAVYVACLPRDAQKRILALTVISLPLVYLCCRIAGMAFSHAQPFATLGFEPLVPHEVDNSFPSDHTAFAFVLATVGFLHQRLVGSLLFVLAASIALSRMLAGLHWGVDVVVAAALGVGAVYAVEYVLNRYTR